MVLLFSQNSLQRRTLVVMLKLGGYNVRIVNDEHEMIDLIRKVPGEVRGVVFGGAGCRRSLEQSLALFSQYEVASPIHLVGCSAADMAAIDPEGELKNRLKLSVCNGDQMLESLRVSMVGQAGESLDDGDAAPVYAD